MVFDDAVGHGFEHHDARETLLDLYGDVFVHRTAPQASGKERRTEVGGELVVVIAPICSCCLLYTSPSPRDS